MKFYLIKWTNLARRPMILDQRTPKIVTLHRKSRSQIVPSCEKLFRM